MFILIPAFEPDGRLTTLVAALHDDAPIIVIDDGSGPMYAEVFDAAEKLGAIVIRFAFNRGKAAALREGFAWLEQHAPGHDVVCADSDGQHTPHDIRRVAHELERRVRRGEPDGIVLGARKFIGNVPLRSRVGNRITTALVRMVTGTRITDTQTGLRGYPHGLLPWARAVPSERFAYELRLLLEASRDGLHITEVPIRTVYLDDNASSHFRPIIDSLQVMAPLLLFGASSLVSFVIDAVAMLTLNALTGSLALAVIGARLLSSGVNFTLNRHRVFRSRGRVRPQILRYALLALVLLAASYSALQALTTLGVALLVAKISSDFVLWLTSFGLQRTVVFGQRRESQPSASLQSRRANQSSARADG